MSNYLRILGVLMIPMFIASCGGEGPTVIPSKSKDRGKIDRKATLQDWRKSEELGTEGSFGFSFGEEQLSTDWGYADFNPLPSGEESRIVLLGNPTGGRDFPKLRIVIKVPFVEVGELAGQSFETERVTLRPSGDRKVGKGFEGSATVTFESVDQKFLVGTFSGVIDAADERIPLEGSFRVQLNILEIAK